MGSKLNGSAKSKAPKKSLEECVVALAMSGKLAGAAKNAVRRQRGKGIAVTTLRGDKIIKRYCGGKEEVLGTVVRQPYTFPQGVKILPGV